MAGVAGLKDRSQTMVAEIAHENPSATDTGNPGSAAPACSAPSAAARGLVTPDFTGNCLPARPVVPAAAAPRPLSPSHALSRARCLTGDVCLLPPAAPPRTGDRASHALPNITRHMITHSGYGYQKRIIEETLFLWVATILPFLCYQNGVCLYETTIFIRWFTRLSAHSTKYSVISCTRQ